ncbi:MAG: autotransporter-associated beta strand repeat-containing protein [Kiritimatiellae bacterium]|nr:autotransporter-associated beta strand repeat-containing protein [Kiritimatiellia bacterium]
MKHVSCMKIAAVLTAVAYQFAGAADGVWTNLTDGQLWGNIVNWQDGVVAEGAGSTAYFNTLDIAVDTTVHLDGPRTLGNLVFGDNEINSAAGWRLDNNANPANVLTLDGAAPGFTVDALAEGMAATIGVNILGSGGLTKTGDGKLTLTHTNSYSGATIVSSGELCLKPAADQLELDLALPSSGLALWLDATQGVTTNASGNVTTWADQSGNNHHAYNNDELGPTVTADINGLPTLRFTSVNTQFLECGGIGGTADITVFFVFKLASVTNSLTSLMSTDGMTTPAGRSIHYIIPSNQKTTFYVTGPGHLYNNTALQVGGVQIKGYVEQGLEGRHYFNGVYDGGDTRSYATTKSLEIFRIGAWMPFSETLDFRRFLDGSIGEVIIYTRALSESERTTVGVYLAEKWGIAEHGYAHSLDVLPAQSAVAVDSGATLALDGLNQRVASISAEAGSTINLGGTLTIDSAQNSSLAGAVSGPGGLVVKGGAAVDIAGTASYRFSTRIDNGSLRVAGTLYAAGSDINARIEVQSGCTLELESWGRSPYDSLGLFTSAAPKLSVDNATIRMSSTTFGAQPVAVSGTATLEAAEGANWHIVDDTSPWQFSSGAGLLLTGAGNAVFAKGFDGSGGIVKTGSGRWSLTGTNSVNGPLTVEEGTLQVASGVLSALPVDGAALWLDATRGVQTNPGGNVTRWADLSGYGRDVTSPNGPTVTSDINGLPTLRFTRANAQYLAGGGLRNMNAVTVFMVHRVESLPAGDWMALLAEQNTSVTSYGNAIHYNIEKDVKKLNFYLAGSTPQSILSDTLAVIGTAQIYEVLHTDAECKHFRDGVPDGSGTRTVKQKRLDDFRIGSYKNGRYYDGSMGEIIIYDRALNNEERAAVYAYLNAKWMNASGISTPAAGESDLLATDAIISVDAPATLDLGGQSHTVATLQGSGTVTNGSVTASVHPGGVGQVGTLKLAEATLSGTLVVDIIAGYCDSLQVTGDLDLSGLRVTFSQVSELNNYKPYLLITYTGELIAPFGEVDLPGSWEVRYTNDKQVKLICHAGTRLILR